MGIAVYLIKTQKYLRQETENWQRLDKERLEIKNKAFRIYMEFGLPKVREARLNQVFAEMDDATKSRWLNQFEEIATESGRIAEEGYLAKYPADEIRRRIRNRFSFLDEESVSIVYGRAGWFAWHEGYPDAQDTLNKNEKQLNQES
jgi:hypothetical protein